MKPYQSFLAQAAARFQAAADGVNARKEAAFGAVERQARFIALRNDFGGALSAGFSVLNKSVPGSLSDISATVDVCLRELLSRLPARPLLGHLIPVAARLPSPAWPTASVASRPFK